MSQRSTHLRCLVICLGALVALAACIGVLAALSYTGTAYHVPGAQRITMDHVFNGTFYAFKQGLNWVPEGASHSHFVFAAISVD
jgi:dipeptidyl aminopeptidase